MRVETSRARRPRRATSYAAPLLTCIALLLAVLVASLGYLLMSGRGNQVAASFIHSQPGALRWNGHDRLNVLVMLVGNESNVQAATDAMMIASYDPSSRSVGMLSIPGNLWVTVPGYGPTRISQAYADGGARLALLTVESAVHVPIPYYAVTGYSGFRQLVDAFGGTDLRVPSEMVGTRLNGQTLSAGVLHLGGGSALAYIRASTPNPEGDVGRLGRLQQIILALKQQGLGPSQFVRIPTIVSLVGGAFATNFPYDQMPDLARMVRTVPTARVRTSILDHTTSAVVNYSTTGTDVLLPDWQRIIAIAQHLFPFPRPTVFTQVLNGTGVSGQATTVADWLRQSRIPVRGTGPAPSYQYARTQVFLRRAAGPAALSCARAVASLLQAPLRIGSIAPAKAPVTVIVGQDYQDLTQH